MTAGPTPNNERRWVCGGGVSLCGPGMPHLDSRGCGYVDAAPVPSPVPSRPDTALLRAWADEIDASYGHIMLMPQEVVLRLAADWIDAQPAADQGPDLSELRAARERTLATVDRHAYAALYAAVDRLLDREGGTQELRGHHGYCDGRNCDGRCLKPKRAGCPHGPDHAGCGCLLDCCR